MVKFINDNPSGLSYVVVQTSPVRAAPEAEDPEKESRKERFYRIVCYMI